MAERRTISPDAPGLELEIEPDPGLEDTACMACWREGRRRPASTCVHTPAERAQAMAHEEDDQVAGAVAARPDALQLRLAAFRRALGWLPWWATAAGRRRMRERQELEERERRAREEQELGSL